MSSVVSIHGVNGNLAGAGVIVAQELVLTCAHVVNTALGRAIEKQTRPDAESEVEIRFAGTPNATVRARLDANSDAWSAPPATRAEGADLCLLKLEGTLPPGATVGRISPVTFEQEFDVRASGYPAEWNNKHSALQLDVGIAKVLGVEGYLWILRADQGSWEAAIATGKRSAGLIYTGFSGGPVHARDTIVGLVAEARKEVRQATAYAIPARNFPARYLLNPAKG